MKKRDLLDELKSAFEFADAILGLAEESEPIRCLADAVAKKLGKLIAELEVVDHKKLSWELDRFSLIVENKHG